MTTPAKRAANIRKATEKARKNYNKFELAELQEIYDLYMESANSITLQLLQYEKDGIVPPARLKQVLKLLNSEIRALNSTTQGMIHAGVNDVVNFSIRQQQNILRGNVPPGTPVAVTRPEFRKINTAAVRAVIKWQPTGETLSNRVWKNLKITAREINKQAKIGIVTGESAQQLSQRIRPFLIEPDKRFRRVRVKGKLTPSKAMKEYSPGRGVYRSAYKNALREARTMYARAYTEGTIHYSKSKRFIKGWISRVGSSDPAPYDLSVNGMFFKKSRGINIPYHPNCMCWAEMVTKEMPESKLKPALSRRDFNRQVLESMDQQAP